jgi:hypothetical protein
VTCRPIAKYQLCKQAAVQQPLLGSSSAVTLFPRQRENTQYWKGPFSVWSVLGYATNSRSVVGLYASPCVGGFEYFHRSPASRRRRRKGDRVLVGYNWITLFLWNINTRTWPSRLGGEGVLESETVKYRHVSHGTRARE